MDRTGVVASTSPPTCEGGIQRAPKPPEQRALRVGAWRRSDQRLLCGPWQASFCWLLRNTGDQHDLQQDDDGDEPNAHPFCGLGS